MLALVILYVCSGLHATTYYVSNKGDDGHRGTSPSAPWRTLSRVSTHPFQPGDSILLRRGDTWRNDPLRISSSGNPAGQIVYGAYGTGDRPAVLGSVRAGDWTCIEGNIWVSGTVIPDDPWEIGFDGPEIFFEEKDGRVTWGAHRVFDQEFSRLSGEYEWTWHKGRIYVCSRENPGSLYGSVEVPRAVHGIRLMDQNYITIDSLAIKYFGDVAIYDQRATIVLRGLRVTHCEIAYIGRKNGRAAYGLSVHHSDSYYAYNEIHNCGRRGISLTMYRTEPITQSNVIIEHNHFHHGWHTTSLDCIAAGDHTIRNIVFRNNLVEGDPEVPLNGINPNSNHLFSDNQSDNGLVRDIYIYNNIFTYAHGSSVKIGAVGNVHIDHNTFYRFNPTLANIQAHVYLYRTPAPVIIRNNIFDNDASDEKLTCIKIDRHSADLLTIDYNLYFQSSRGQRFFRVNLEDEKGYRVDEWDEYRLETGFDPNSPQPADPLFVQPPVHFGLEEGSPAIGAGCPVDLVQSDYHGNPVNHPPDIGAVQTLQENENKKP